MGGEWRRSSFCAAGDCVLLSAFTDRRTGETRIRFKDSKHPAGRKLVFSVSEFKAFLAACKDGEFDDLTGAAP